MVMGLEGKRVKVVYDDGSAVTYKIGVLAEFSNGFLILDTGDAIATSKIIRIETEAKP